MAAIHANKPSANQQKNFRGQDKNCRLRAMHFASAGQADVSGESYGTNKTRKPVKLEIMNLLFVALKGPLPGQ